MANPTYDVVVIGSGPGGYETAIRSTQLGFKTAIVERDRLGGVCLNIGCIPTKALLKSAEVLEETRHLADFGLNLKGEVTVDFPKVIERSRKVADGRNKGVAFLMNKNKIDVLFGHLGHRSDPAADRDSGWQAGLWRGLGALSRSQAGAGARPARCDGDGPAFRRGEIRAGAIPA